VSVAPLVVADSMVAAALAVAEAGPVVAAVVAGPAVVAGAAVHNAESESENRHLFLRRNYNGIP